MRDAAGGQEAHHDHAVGESIGIRLEIDHLVAFPRSGG